MIASLLLKNAIIDWLIGKGITLTLLQSNQLELSTDTMISDLEAADNPVVEALRLTNKVDGRKGYAFGLQTVRQADGSYVKHAIIRYDDGTTSFDQPADFIT